MAISPLFWSSGSADKAALLLSLRLDQTRVDGMPTLDATIDQELQSVRLGLFRRLGTALVTTLLATSYTDNPTTEAEIKRVSACRAEALWLRLNLLRVLPQLWMDSSSNQKTVWNEDAFSRERAQQQQAANQEKGLQRELDALLEVLAADDIEADDSFRVATYPSEESATFWAGQSVFGRVTTLFGRPVSTTPTDSTTEASL